MEILKAVVENGIVTNIIVVEPNDTISIGVMIPNNTQVGIGWYYDGINFTLPVQLLADRQSAKWEEIKAERDRLKFNGVFVSNKWIHTDTYSRTQWMGMVMMGASLPVVPWTTMDGTTINTTAELATAVFQAVAAQDIAIFTAAANHRAQMIASSDPLSYDFSTGWPATYIG